MLGRPKQATVHGTITGYHYRKCKCVDCKLAWSKYQSHRRKRPKENAHKQVPEHPLRKVKK